MKDWVFIERRNQFPVRVLAQDTFREIAKYPPFPTTFADISMALSFYPTDYDGLRYIFAYFKNEWSVQVFITNGSHSAPQ